MKILNTENWRSRIHNEAEVKNQLRVEESKNISYTVLLPINASKLDDFHMVDMLHYFHNTQVNCLDVSHI